MNAYKADSETVTTVHAIVNGGIQKLLTDTRPIYPYTLFNKSALQLRRIGALGGKTHGRNRRARNALMPTTPAPLPARATRRQTTAEALAVLGARFPWLRGVEQQRSLDRPSPLR